MLTINRTRITALTAAPKSFLGNMDLFKGIPPEALREIEQRMVEKRYAKHESIFLEGDPAKSVWFVKEGHVKAGVNTPNGRCQTLCMVGAKGMFGTCCCLGGGEYPCHAVAESDVTVVSMPLSDFLHLMEKHPSVSMGLVAQVSKRLRHSKDMQTFEQESAEKRILHVLLGMVREFGMTVPLTKREIAEMAGTTVETAIRTFTKLEDAGLVVTERGKITAKNMPGLNQRMEAA